MKKIKLKKEGILGLAYMADSVAPKDLATIKAIRLTEKAIADLKSSCQDIIDLEAKIQAKREKLMEGYEKEKEALEEGKSLQALDIKYTQLLNEKTKTERKKVQELLKEETEAELSEDTYKTIREIAKAHAIVKMQNKREIIELFDALKITDEEAEGKQLPR